MDKIKSISAFDSAYELLLFVNGNEFSLTEDFELSEDELDMLKSLNDYEYFKFFLINENTVICCESYGDVSGTPMTWEEFCESTISYVKENA